ncbi:hypothetical protein HOD29_00570 [archaeon]|jgi:hypothetical protein|nr:hypothetical protein [archaeon]
MDLEILSGREALKFVPEKKTYAIRIGGSFDLLNLSFLKENDNWVGENHYYFDDMWPRDWKEYSWYDMDGEEFEKYFRSEKKKYPKMTKESLIGYFESRGHPYGRCTLFDEKIAKKILNDFEEVNGEVESVLIHSIEGKHRPAAVGMAMNEIYSWRYKELKEKFPSYRRYVYGIMMDVGKGFGEK